jgi:SAM-dependent methyltransferase
MVHYTGLLERRRRILIRHLDGIEPGKLLEIGCGDGSFLSLARECGWEVTGVDSDPNAALAAQEKYGITVQVGRFEDCNFPRGYFDLIIMNHVIEHVLDPVQLLCECAAILRKEGSVLLVTPNSAGVGHTVFGRNWRGLEPPRHLHLFSPGVMMRITQGTGLRCVYLKTTSVNAEAIYWGSTGLVGAGALMPNTQPLRFLFMSWLYQYYALARNLWVCNGGEEIVMVCRKNAQVPVTG